MSKTMVLMKDTELNFERKVQKTGHYLSLALTNNLIFLNTQLQSRYQ